MPCLRHNNTTKDIHMLNEHDLADFERLPVEKLYNLPRCSYFEFDNVPYYLDHIDGMYSVCTDEDGNVYHIGASEEVEVKSKEAKNDT